MTKLKLLILQREIKLTDLGRRLGVNRTGASKQQGSGMKAWHVFDGDPGYGDLLIYAISGNSAKMIAMSDGPYTYDYYIGLRARRSPEHDSEAVDRPRVIETNEERPNGVPSFYDDS